MDEVNILRKILVLQKSNNHVTDYYLLENKIRYHRGVSLNSLNEGFKNGLVKVIDAQYYKSNGVYNQNKTIQAFDR